MAETRTRLSDHLLRRLRQVQENLGLEPLADDPGVRFADAVDSMGLVEFLTLLAADCGVTPDAIEQTVGRRFGTVSGLATALEAAGIEPSHQSVRTLVQAQPDAAPPQTVRAWLAATAIGLPHERQSTALLDARLHRPDGWLASHAGIHTCCRWCGEDVLDRATEAARLALDQAGLSASEVGALLVTATASPQALGLAAILHHRLGLPSQAVALEVGGACMGFLAALWTGQRLLSEAKALLILALEAPGHWLTTEPGPAGETAALLGEAVAACVCLAQPRGSDCRPLLDVQLGIDGSQGHLLRLQSHPGRGPLVDMDGFALAGRAIHALSEQLHRLIADHGLTLDDLAAVVVHAGNGRMPELLARRLGLPATRVWSETARTGNLGSASLPVAWAARAAEAAGPVVWMAVGPGLTWGAALFGAPTFHSLPVTLSAPAAGLPGSGLA